MTKSMANKKMVKRIVDRDDLKFWYETTQIMYRAGRIDDKTYRTLTSILVAEDSQGKVWTIGARSGKWYRKEGMNWVEGNPDKRLAMLAPEPEISRIENAFRKLETRRRKRIEDWERRGRPKPPGFLAGGIQAAEIRLEKQGGKRAPSVPDTQKCMKCGITLPEGSRFCLSCGEPVKSSAPESVNCPACGNENPTGARFCRNCGTPFQE